MFIDTFLQRGIRLPVIREAAKWLSLVCGSVHPLAVPNLFTYNGRIIATKNIDAIVAGVAPDGVSPDAVYIDLAKMGQIVIGATVEGLLARVDYENALDPTRFWPIGKDRDVVIDRERSFGRPLDPRSGVPTNVLYGMYKSGETVESVARWFGAHRKAVRDAIDFESTLGYRSFLAA
ncbi:MAG: hypothetical protein P4L33_01045 [Capsulimonadaceae bacterium]|nr:hypothetical protein [Capsulimonadaceae bacterium]